MYSQKIHSYRVKQEYPCSGPGKFLHFPQRYTFFESVPNDVFEGHDTENGCINMSGHTSDADDVDSLQTVSAVILQIPVNISGGSME